MAIIKKTISAENLDKISVLVNDVDPNSKYFKVTELPDTFTGGKNAFLIQGSEYLVPDTLIKIEIKDAQGNIIYHEPGEGIVSASVGGEPIVTEYYEGVSKVVSVYVYPNRTLDVNGNYSDGTAFGPCTITILGELSTYDNNGTNVSIPTNWEGKYNVRWQRSINVNPTLANTTKVRFYRRPVAAISETLSPIYAFDATGSKVASNVTQSFANIKVSQLDTFAGDVKRIKVYRTSQGDISDYDLIQDILVESKELLSTTALSGSVVGTAGLFTSEVVKKLWNTGSLNTFLTSSRIDNGLRLSGSGKFTYTSSLNLTDVSVYEFAIDAFYSSSTSSDLQIYLSGSNNGEVLVGTLNGINPTKNLKDTIIQFSLNKAEPTASLYLSQSQGEWHVGNLSLQLTQDTAFSPAEVSFVTSMPTVIGNETYNFKFEFYDVNNNYVPVAVTQSALFTGGNNNVGGTLTFISSSASQSLADLTRVSSSISGTMTVYSSSASGTIGSVSSSVSGTITTLSGSVSGTIGSVSSSVSGTIGVLSGSVSSSIYILSGSVSTSVKDAKAEAFANVQRLANGDFPGTFIDSSSIYSPVIGGQLGYFSTLFKVGTTPSIYLDARQNPRKIFIGGAIPAGQTEYSGAFNNANTSIYLDSGGQFSLKDKLTFTGDTLTVNGTINVTGGNAATDANALLYSQRAVSSGSASANAAQTAAELFATGIGTNAVASGSASASAAQGAAIAQAKADASSSINLLANGGWTAGSGTFITSRSISSPVLAGNAGYISEILKVGQNGITLDGGNKKIYVGTGTYANANTPFYFASGSTNVFSLGSKLTFDGDNLSIQGGITATSLTLSPGVTVPNASVAGLGSLALKSSVSATTDVTGLGALATRSSVNATYIDDNSISTGKIIADSIVAEKIASLKFFGRDAQFDTGSIAGWNFNGNSLFKSNGTHSIKLSSTDASYYITRDSTNQTKVKISPATTFNKIAVDSFDFVNFTYASATRLTVTGDSSQTETRTLPATSGRHDGPGGPGTNGPTFGVIQLIYPTEEIWVDSDGVYGLDFLGFIATIAASGGTINNDDGVDATYRLTLVAEKFANYTDAANRTNIIQTYKSTIVENTLKKPAGETFTYADYAFGLSGGGFQVDSSNNWFYVYLEQYVRCATTNGVPEEDSALITLSDFGGTVKVQFGRVDNGFSQLAPAGLQVYTGVRTYMNASVSGVSGDNFFEVKGKSQFLSGLNVNGTFSATTKQFQITHPLNENKWLYHTAIEGPQADLIYRGKLNLINGEGSSNIDVSSRLTNGTFNSLTRNPQLFLQNNDSFDRIKGKIENGNVYVISENQNSSASVDWTVIAERCDTEVLMGGTYGGDGKYKTEKWKREFRDTLMITGSV
jgi:hypothetical protein